MPRKRSDNQRDDRTSTDIRFHAEAWNADVAEAFVAAIAELVASTPDPSPEEKEGSCAG